MQILSYQVFNTRGTQYLEFMLNNEEHAFLTSPKVMKIVKEIAPWMDLSQSVPLVLIYHIDPRGNCKIQINVADPYNEKIIKEILIQYIKANILVLEEANNIFNLVCRILKIEFKPFDKTKLLGKQIDKCVGSLAKSLLQGIITTSSQDKTKINQPAPKFQKELHDFFEINLK